MTICSPNRDTPVAYSPIESDTGFAGSRPESGFAALPADGFGERATTGGRSVLQCPIPRSFYRFPCLGIPDANAQLVGYSTI